MPDLTPESLAELRRLMDDGTPGPWRMDGPWWYDDDPYHDCTNVISGAGRFAVAISPPKREDPSGKRDQNAALIAAAVTALPALLDAAERDLGVRAPDTLADLLMRTLRDIEAERDALVAKVDRVRALHVAYYPFRPGRAYCGACEGDEFVPYPCSTIRALDGTTNPYRTEETR